MAEQSRPWWERGIIYQVYPRSFQDSNRDGIGDLAGILGRLDYLQSTLGIDAIWLSPFYPSPMADFGYDVSNYVDVDPIFGDLATFDELVDASHRRGLKVIVDFVPNHTSEQHPWFLESRSSRDNPKRDWYVWADAKPDRTSPPLPGSLRAGSGSGSPPNNWVSVFGGPAWEWDETTGQYYLHSFLKEQPDLNWRNSAVKNAMLDILRFWLERGVDGFRIDVAHFIMKDPELRDNPPNPTPPRVALHGHDYEAQLHLYDKAHPDVHGVFREIRRLLEAYGDPNPRMAVGEIYEFDWPVWASYYGGQLDELNMPFNFALLGVPWTAAEVRVVVDATEAAVPPGGWPNYVLGNHDRHRVASRVGPEQARVAMMLLLTLRGTPTLYYGDEIGMQDVLIPPELVQDPWEKNEPGIGVGRDPERTPMQWDAGPNAGFCPEGVVPWLPIADDYQRVNVAAEQEDPCSMLSLTRALIRLRQERAALISGRYRPVDEVPEACFVYLRQMEEERCLIALNFSGADQDVALAEFGNGTILLSTHLDRESEEDLSAFELRSNEGCIVALE